MDKVKKHIDEAFKLISAIPVAQDNVEIMAAAKEHLRAAYKLLGEGENDGG